MNFGYIFKIFFPSKINFDSRHFHFLRFLLALVFSLLISIFVFYFYFYFLWNFAIIFFSIQFQIFKSSKLNFHWKINLSFDTWFFFLEFIILTKVLFLFSKFVSKFFWKDFLFSKAMNMKLKKKNLIWNVPFLFLFIFSNFALKFSSSSIHYENFTFSYRYSRKNWRIIMTNIFEFYIIIPNEWYIYQALHQIFYNK